MQRNAAFQVSVILLGYILKIPSKDYVSKINLSWWIRFSSGVILK